MSDRDDIHVLRNQNSNLRQLLREVLQNNERIQAWLDTPPTGRLWDDNEIQFARLLCELNAAGMSYDIAGLLESMDLELKDLEELFERAHEVWEWSKREHCS